MSNRCGQLGILNIDGRSLSYFVLKCLDSMGAYLRNVGETQCNLKKKEKKEKNTL